MESLLGLPAKRSEISSPPASETSGQTSDNATFSEDSGLTSDDSYRTALRYNPLTLHNGTFLADVANSSSGGSLDSSEAGTYNCVHLPNQKSLPLNIEDSLAGVPYVFEDDISSCCPRRLFHSPAKLRPQQPAFSEEIMSPEDWEDFNVKRGRSMAKTLLRPKFRSPKLGSDSDTASMSMSDDELRHPAVTQPSKVPPRPGAFLGKVLERKKIFTKSLSPLDNKEEEEGAAAPSKQHKKSEDKKENTLKKHRISELAVKALAETPGLLLSPDTVLSRNTLADFAEWEALLAKRHESSSDQDSWEEKERQLYLRVEVDPPRPTAPPPPPTRTVPIRTISILSFAQVFSSSQEEEKTLVASFQQPIDQLDLSDFLEEPRPTPDDMAVVLGIEDDGRMLLDYMRANAGIIEDLSESCPPSSIPWLHLFDDFWMPHYEEYVVRAVHAFARQLKKTHEIKVNQRPH